MLLDRPAWQAGADADRVNVCIIDHIEQLTARLSPEQRSSTERASFSGNMLPALLALTVAAALVAAGAFALRVRS